MNEKYDHFGLYNDPSDKRLIVPKRNPLLGWTIKVGHPGGAIAWAMALSVVAASIILKKRG